MKANPRLFLAGLAALGLTGIPAAGQPQSAEPPPVQATAGDIAAIRAAKEPSSAIEAYARADKSSAAKRAYVRKMTELGRPEMAESQARELAALDPADGLARAVVAYAEAQRDQTSDAVRDIAEAARLSHDEPFVQRTAGQLIAWFDTRVDQSGFSDETKDMIVTIRRNLAGETVYDDAYRRALAAYADEPTASEPTASPAPPPTTTYVGTTYVYTVPYVTYYDPWWYDRWYWGPGVVFFGDFDHDRFRRHHRDGDRFGRRDFGRGGLGRRDRGGDFIPRSPPRVFHPPSRNFVPQHVRPRTFVPHVRPPTAAPAPRAPALPPAPRQHGRRSR